MKSLLHYLAEKHEIIAAFLLVIILSGYLSFFSPKGHYVVHDYTFRIAEAFTHGELGISERPSWLGELVPFQGQYFSVFPLGSVLVMLPWAVLKNFDVIPHQPTQPLVAIIGILVTLFSFLLCGLYEMSIFRRILFSLFPIFGTWSWANLSFASSWQLALGFAMLGELGALYFTFRKKPFWAGLFFALAFGNRTEIIITLPIFLFIFWRLSDATSLKEFLWEVAPFFFVPFVLGMATLGYNFLRFSSPLDFGYSRIPGILEEPGYRHGFFSLYAIRENFEQMLIRGWKQISFFPYFIPTGWGGSIFVFCPFLFLLFRRNS
ncbi:MAG: hypothetical protein PHN89_03710, partial [Candidatus Pacebacteria bacterium]|nr:hypothetical protein [Candidatus Paceibacterota bacterium]